jgi:hypothetical protein
MARPGELADRLAHLLGRRFVTDFRIVSFHGGGDREPEAVLLMHGEHYRISLQELETIIERGLVTEMPQREGA